MDDDAHEVGLGRSDDSDRLGLREWRAVFVGEDWGEGGEVLKCVFSFQEVFVWGQLFRVLLPGGGDWEAPEAPEEEWGGGSHRAEVADDGE